MVRTSVHDAQWTPHQTYAEFSAGWGVATRVLTAQYAARHSAESVRQDSRRFIPDGYELRVGCVPKLRGGSWPLRRRGRPKPRGHVSDRAPGPRTCSRSNVTLVEGETVKTEASVSHWCPNPKCGSNCPGADPSFTRAQFKLVEALKGGRRMRRRLSRRGSGISGRSVEVDGDAAIVVA
jgi:hypothetical protein